MCGFTGILGGEAPTDARRAQVARMAATLAHRGPDADGAWADEGVALGHRRLSILDLSKAGAQPMVSVSGRFVIAYNGEIYDHLTLRERLGAAGAAPQWRGHSDTETLLAAIEAWGVEGAVKASTGMFAFAVWDRQTGTLSLARDRLGEKPLYWGWAGDSLVFGSELRALRAHPGFAGGVDPAALAEYLRAGYVPAPRSIHPGIFKLEPGTILTADRAFPASAPGAPLRPGEAHGSISIARYWAIDDEARAGRAQPLRDAGEAAEALSDALARAIRGQLLSDVPVGAFLSGGVDSSAVVALMQQATNKQVRTFTIGFDEAGYDESPHAEAVAAHLETDHITRRLSAGDARAVIPRLAEIYDEPFADSSQIPTVLLCETAAARVSVALSGDGADELFGGYNRHIHGPRLWSRLALVPHPLRRWAGRAMLGISADAWNAAGARYNALVPARRGLNNTADKAHKLGAALESVDSLDDLYRQMAGIWPEPGRLLAGGQRGVTAPPRLPDTPGAAHAERMMLIDLMTYLPDDILCKVDRAAMASSLETRVPFLDREVVALAMRMPEDLKIAGGTGKLVLRELLYRHVPRALIDRPKAGFAIPIGAWLRGPLREWAERLLDPDALGRDGLLDPEAIRPVWADHLRATRDRSAELWTILMFQAWRERWT